MAAIGARQFLLVCNVNLIGQPGVFENKVEEKTRPSSFLLSFVLSMLHQVVHDWKMLSTLYPRTVLYGGPFGEK